MRGQASFDVVTNEVAANFLFLQTAEVNVHKAGRGAAKVPDNMFEVCRSSRVNDGEQNRQPELELERRQCLIRYRGRPFSNAERINVLKHITKVESVFHVESIAAGESIGEHPLQLLEQWVISQCDGRDRVNEDDGAKGR
jgi:hypothetical protein